jgi:DNA polymerase-1
MKQAIIIPHVNIIKSIEGLKKLKQKLSNCPVIVVDFETSDGNFLTADICGIGIALSFQESYYIPTAEIPVQAIKQELGPILKLKQLAGHNVIYDLMIGKRFGFDLNYYYDTKMMYHMLFPDERETRLRHIVKRYLSDYKLIMLEDLIGSGRKKISVAEVPIEQLAEYSCRETAAIMRCVEILKNELQAQHIWQPYIQLHQPLFSILADMTLTGIKLDMSRLKKLTEEYKQKLEKERQIIFKLARKEFNINSPKQLIPILQERGITIRRQTEKGQFSVNEDSLKEIYTETKDALCKHLLEYRKSMKILSTYLEPFIEHVDENNRLHGSFQLTATATGRLASANPNLQNIPPEIREIFIADAGKVFIVADYSQIELRVLAYLSKDKNMIKAFLDGEDIHAKTAAIFGSKYDKATARLKAKIVNFSLIYGASVNRIAKELEVSEEEAKTFMDNFYRFYPATKTYRRNLISLATRIGYVATMGGWRRPLPGIKSRNIREKKMAERMALNTPIQGSASDIIKAAMIDLVKELAKNKLSGKLLLQVHDELVLEVPKEEVYQTKKIVEKSMLRNGFFPAIEFLLKVNINVNKRWIKS